MYRSTIFYLSFVLFSLFLNFYFFVTRPSTSSASTLSFASSQCQSLKAFFKGRTFSQHGQDMWLQEFIFPDLVGGFFIEAGALDGLSLSNTAYFERYRKWQGLCFEPDPNQNEKIPYYRGCDVIRAAISIRDGEMVFWSSMVPGWSGFWDLIPSWKHQAHKEKGGKNVTVTTVRLDTILRKYGVNIVNFFSLDVEGGELDVLHSIGLDEVKIEVFMIEVDHVHEAAIRQFMEKNNYVLIYEFPQSRDFVFVQKNSPRYPASLTRMRSKEQ